MNKRNYQSPFDWDMAEPYQTRFKEHPESPGEKWAWLIATAAMYITFFGVVAIAMESRAELRALVAIIFGE